MAASRADAGGQYEASSLAKWFHSAPHKDFKLEDTTTIFSPDDKSYREALYVIAIFIASFGAFLFLLVLIYYTCCFCICGKSTETRQRQSSCCSKSCLQFQIFLLAIICCGAVVVGFVYNGRASDGVDQFRNSVDDIQDDITYASSLGGKMNSKLTQAEDLISTIEQVFPEAKRAYELVNNMISNLSYINHLLPQDVVNTSSDSTDKINEYDNYRWLGTVILLSWCILLCIFLFWIACQLNTCLLIMTTAFCLLTILLTWSATGADFGMATGTGDFCVHPKQAVQNIKKDPETSAVISYYMACNEQDDPFANGLNELESGLHEAISNITGWQVPSYEHLKEEILNDLHYVNNNLVLYEASFTCEKIHKEYINAMDGLCGKGLNSLGIIILAVSVIAFFAGLLTCCMCPLLKHRHPGPRTYNDIQAPPDAVGNNVLWLPHDVDVESDESFHRRHAHPNERSPLMNPGRHAHPNERTPLINPDPGPSHHGNVNFIHVNYHGLPSQEDQRPSGGRHSF